jgi:hypothetical protein
LPTVGDGNGFVHCHMQVAQFGDVGAGFGGVVETVIGFRQPFLPGLHDGLAALVIAFADLF